VLLTMTSTASSATDLGFVLHKHPDRVQTFDLAAGRAHVFYPEATPERCTVALLVETDPVALVRGKQGGRPAFSLGEYVNDRPYAGGSHLAQALGRVFRSALAGSCPHRPELVDRVVPLDIRVASVPAPGGLDRVVRLFAPLGWSVDATPMALDPEVPRWGEAAYVDLTLTGAMTVRAALQHLYVLLPVLAGSKHYWVSSDEVDKLLRAGSEWLPAHPEREWITHRYLARKRESVDDALARLIALDDAVSEDEDEGGGGGGGEQREDRPVPLAVCRRAAVLAELRALDAHHVVDLGCGPGALLRDLLADASFTRIVGADVSAGALDAAARRLRLARMPDSQRARLELLHSSVTYRDPRLDGADAIVLMEVVEHVDPERLPTLARTVFGSARPRAVIVTTPNVEFNVRYEGLAPGAFRHPDHRFEWTRAEFEDWCQSVGAAYGYAVRLAPVGEVDPEVGPSTQMAVFTRADSALAQGSEAEGSGG